MNKRKQRPLRDSMAPTSRQQKASSILKQSCTSLPHHLLHYDGRYQPLRKTGTSGDSPLMAKTKQPRGTLPAGTLSEWMAALSPRRRELIRKVFQEPRAYVLLSVRAAGERLETDPATLVRIVQRMGFANYRAFQNYLQDVSIANATSLDGMEATGHLSDDEGNFEHYVRAATEQDVRNLTAVRTSLDTQRLKVLAKRIHKAKHLLIIGGDLAEAMVYYLGYCFATLGVPCMMSTSAGHNIHLTRTMQKSDLVIAISFRKGLRQTIEGMKRAKANGAYCVGITGTYISPIARFADEFFVAPVESGTFIDSYVAPIGLANQILAATANYRRGLSLELLQEVAEEQRSGFRWYESE